MRRWLAAAGVLLLPLSACSGDGGRDDTFVLVLDGRAEIRGGDGSSELDTGRHRLRPGDQVRITRGSATLGLPGESRLELRAGRRGGADSVLEVAPVPRLVDGHALLVADGDEGSLRAGAATISLRDGAARVRRSTGVSVAVYDGDAAVGAHGLERPVRALRQLSITDSTTLPRRANPLVFDRDDTDPWDRRYLGPAISLGAQLDRMSAAVSRRVPARAAATAEQLREVVPALAEEPALRRVAVPAGRAVGETVVGASIAAAGDGDFVERWDAAFDFRGQGADWGLVALDQQARRDAVIEALDGVLDDVVDGPIVVAGPAPVDLAGTGGTPPTTAPPPTGPPPANPPPPAPREPEPEPEPEPPLPPAEPSLLDPVEGLLGPTGDSAGQLLGAVTETVGGLLGG